MIHINIAKDFSDTPGGRYKKDGPNSGEEFRDTILIPKYKEAINKDEPLCVNLDGGYGYPLSFLEAAFGGLIIKEDDDRLYDILILICEDEPYLKEKIYNIINEAIVKIGMEPRSIPIKKSGIDYILLLRAVVEVSIYTILIFVTPIIIFRYTELFIIFSILFLIIISIISRFS